MRCAAPVSECYLQYDMRASKGTRRCRRNAKVWLPGAFGERCFCYQHAELWRTHNRIVQQIRNLPER